MKTKHAAAVFLAACAVLGSRLAAQRPAFESVSVVRNTSGAAAPEMLRLMPDGGVIARNVTLRQLARFAYQRHAFDRRRIEGGPAWIDVDRFDLEARYTGGHVFEADGFPRQTLVMLRKVLEQRFKLKVRDEATQMPVYELRVSDRGAAGGRLREVDIDCGALMREKVKNERANAMQAGRPVCALAMYPGRMTADAITMPALASALSGTLDRIVVDRTGLSGSYALELEAVEIRAPGPIGPSARASETKQSIFTALPEQLGLELEAATGPVEVVVIESAEPATEAWQG